MLITKAWIEVRWRALFSVATFVAMALSTYSGGVSSPEAANRLLGAMGLLWVVSAATLAGSGIKTQASFQAMKGLHGSTAFTLSLPVSRFRLLAVRAGVGLAGVLTVILISSTAAWFAFPLVRADSLPFDLLKWLLSASCCAAGVYSISVLASTVLDEMWQVWGTILVIGALKWLTVRYPPPLSFDVFRVMTDASPLVTGTLPWPAVFISLALGLAAFLMAVRVVQARDY